MIITSSNSNLIKIVRCSHEVQRELSQALERNRDDISEMFVQDTVLLRGISNFIVVCGMQLAYFITVKIWFYQTS